jgi:hypothetical protein
MRKINYGLMAMLAVLLFATSSCGDADRQTYDGPNYVLFSDTLTVRRCKITRRSSTSP